MKDCNGAELKVGDYVFFKSSKKFLAVIDKIHIPEKVLLVKCIFYYKRVISHSYFLGAELRYASPEEAAIYLLEE